jgi:hypothetical protein
VKRSKKMAAVLSGIAVGGSVLMGASPAQAAPATPAQAAPVTPMATCGANFYPAMGGGTSVTYKHCTSGSDSVVVKAIINNGFDSDCERVGPNDEKFLMVFIWPGSFDRIVRC